MCPVHGPPRGQGALGPWAIFNIGVHERLWTMDRTYRRTLSGFPYGPTPCPDTASYSGPRYCLIFWSQVLPHTLVPSTASVPHTLVPGPASYPGPRYCLIPWSQVLPHTLVPVPASYPGPRYCLIPWSQVLPHFLVPRTASFSGPRDCLSFWSQGLPHTLVPGTASFSGPKACFIFWSHVDPMQVPKWTPCRVQKFPNGPM